MRITLWSIFLITKHHISHLAWFSGNWEKWRNEKEEGSRDAPRIEFRKKKIIMFNSKNESKGPSVRSTLQFLHSLLPPVARDVETFANKHSRARAYKCVSRFRGRKFKERRLQGGRRRSAKCGRSTKDKSYRRSCTNFAGESRRAAHGGARVPRASAACRRLRTRRTQKCSAHHLRLGIPSAAARSPANTKWLGWRRVKIFSFDASLFEGFEREKERYVGSSRNYFKDRRRRNEKQQ